MKQLIIAIALVFFGCGAATATAWSPAARLFAAGAMDAGDAARQAAASTGGRVIDVQSSGSGEQRVYLVKVLLGDGRVKVVRIAGGQGASPRR